MQEIEAKSLRRRKLVLGPLKIFLIFALSKKIKKIKKSILTQRKFFQFVEARLNIGMPHKSP